MIILNVDDHADNLYLLKSLLSPQGHVILDASNGKEALDIIKHTKIDVIISDILMPVMDGFSLCREIRNHPQYNHIPFIIYTATYTGEQDAVLAKTVGADEFIVKPCEPEEFLDRISKVTVRSKSSQAAQPRPISDEGTVLKLYNERLIRKLEQKMQELEAEVSEREKAMDALQRSEGMLKATQALGKLGGWVYDIKDDTMFWTEEMYRLHDIDPQSPEAKNLIETSINCYPKTMQPKVLKAMSAMRESGTPYELESWFTTMKGRKIFIRASAVAEWEDNQVRRVIGTFQDLTERKEAETNHQKLEQQLRQAQKLDSIGQLAGGVAHDFNNVLTVILGYSEEIMNALHDSDPIKEDIQEILNAGQRASSLTRQLLTFSRKQANKPELVNLNETISNLYKMLMRLIGEDIEFDLDLAEELPLIMADVGQIEQVIMNLVINAREAMQMGGKLMIKTFGFAAEEAFKAQHPMISDDHYVVMIVKDTGCGMDELTKERVFEPFFTTKAKAHGTGLGLPTVYGIVRQAGGYIHVESAPGKGSSFVVMIPATDQHQLEQKQEAATLKASGNQELVLVVEDDPAISDLTGRIIHKMGFEVVLAESADQAMVMIEDEGLRPRLVIADVVMPGLSGLELSHILRFKHPEIAVILMSGYTAAIIAQHGEIDPDTPFIQKPFSRAELSQKIVAALNPAELKEDS
jgi:two-component system, cell cycle sensor histidine kinase and response regulator CckA